MISAAMAVALTLSVGSSFGARHARHRRETTALEHLAENRSSSDAGVVDGLYTYGAPQFVRETLQNPASPDGCFAGYRITREAIAANRIDKVVAVFGKLGYAHPKMPVLRLDVEKVHGVEECGWIIPESTFRFGDPSLHDSKAYTDMTRPSCGKVSSLGMRHSYNNDVGEVAEAAKQQGWGLVDTAFGYGKLSWLPLIGKKEVSHLFQDPDTLDCMLTFEGSDSLENWLDNLKLWSTPFCELPASVHSGFLEGLKVMVNGDDFQNNIRPKLKYCKSVTTLGHSLGGVMATLFAACANNHAKADGTRDFQKITWTKETPRKMEYK